MSDDFLRIVSSVVWVAVTILLWRSDGPKVGWKWPTWYVMITAISVTVWRIVVTLWNLNPSYVPSDLFTFVVRNMQPTIYVMLGFALLIAIRAHPRER